MRRSTNIFLKSIVWVGCLLPLADLLRGAATHHLGRNPVNEVLSVTGLSALWLLAITLAITPVRSLSPRFA
ncbi:MAG: hypothetical protein WAL45_16055 [Terracidiphilus sp.]